MYAFRKAQNNEILRRMKRSRFAQGVLAALAAMWLAPPVCPQPRPDDPKTAELRRAVRAGDATEVIALIEGGADPNAYDSLGATSLLDAVWSGEISVVAALIDHGADVNAKHREAGSTPLHYAIVTNHPAIADLLIRKGADIRTKYRSGTSPLHLAASRGLTGVVQLLLARGVPVNDSGADGAPLDEAAWNGHADAARALIAAGANVNRRNEETGATALHAAAAKGHTEVAQLLLDAHADLDALDNSGATPLDDALHYRQIKVANLLLSRGGKMNFSQLRGAAPARPEGIGQAGPRALHDAILRGQAELVAVLIEQGADVNAPGPQGTTPMEDACLKGFAEIVEMLLAKGVGANQRDRSGSTPLHQAALGGSRSVVDLLLGHGAEINARDEELGATPLYHAASWGRVEALETLLLHGADPALKSKRGLTALQAAEENNQQETASRLRSALKQSP